MKKRNFKIILILNFVAILYLNCAPHCDDEDYKPDKKEVALKHSDSLNTVKID